MFEIRPNKIGLKICQLRRDLWVALGKLHVEGNEIKDKHMTDEDLKKATDKFRSILNEWKQRKISTVLHSQLVYLKLYIEHISVVSQSNFSDKF